MSHLILLRRALLRRALWSKCECSLRNSRANEAYSMFAFTPEDLLCLLTAMLYTLTYIYILYIFTLLRVNAMLVN